MAVRGICQNSRVNTICLISGRTACRCQICCRDGQIHRTGESSRLLHITGHFQFIMQGHATGDIIGIGCLVPIYRCAGGFYNFQRLIKLNPMTNLQGGTCGNGETCRYFACNHEFSGIGLGTLYTVKVSQCCTDIAGVEIGRTIAAPIRIGYGQECILVCLPVGRSRQEEPAPGTSSILGIQTAGEILPSVRRFHGYRITHVGTVRQSIGGHVHSSQGQSLIAILVGNGKGTAAMTGIGLNAGIGIGASRKGEGHIGGIHHLFF